MAKNSFVTKVTFNAILFLVFCVYSDLNSCVLKNNVFEVSAIEDS